MVSAADASRDIRFSAWSTWVAEQLLPIALRIPVLSAFDVRDAECSRLLKEVVALLRTCVLRYGTSIVDYILKCVSGVWGVDVSHPSLMEDAVSLQNALIQGQQLEAETAMRKLVEKVRLPQSGRV
jgi:class 3 adenylate cyclase